VFLGNSTIRKRLQTSSHPPLAPPVLAEKKELGDTPILPLKDCKRGKATLDSPIAKDLTI